MTTFMKSQATKSVPGLARKAVKVASKASRLDRIVADQQVAWTADMPFMVEAQAGITTFQQCIAILYGPSGLGKTRMASTIPGHYIIDSENKSQWNKRRATYVPNWVSFKAFIDEMERHPELVATVQMWCIDTIDVLVTKCMSTICSEWEIMDLSEEGFSRAWQELVQEVVFQVLRLRALGPGVLMVSHEREVPIKRRHIQIDFTRMDVSKSVYSALSFISDMTLHMTYTVKDTVAGDIKAQRCLTTRGTEAEDAKNCTTAKLPDSLPFKTEEEAVRKLLAAFQSPGEAMSTSPTAENPVPGERRKLAKKVVKKAMRNRENPTT